MLVLTRKAGQRIHIGGEIVVEISRISGNRVSLAIDAPATIPILRGEHADRDAQRAAQAVPPIVEQRRASA